MVVADELEADWSRVRVIQAPGDEERYGNQDTDGSQQHAPLLRSDATRRGGGANDARDGRGRALAGAAAPGRCPQPRDRGSRSDRRLSFGALAKEAAELKVPDRATLKLKEPKDFRYIGKDECRRRWRRTSCRGGPAYGIDTMLDGMLFAVVARSPGRGRQARSFDASEAVKIPGVVRVVPVAGTPLPALFHPLGGVAVVATNTWAAIRGREALVAAVGRRSER